MNKKSNSKSPVKGNRKLSKKEKEALEKAQTVAANNSGPQWDEKE